jgi:tetratricopeptide (TPR) repeat protein
VLLAALFATYFPALRGGFLWDDDAHVTKLALRPLHGLWRIWFEAGATQQYYPVLHSAFWLEHRLWGDSVLGYHAANVVLHAGAAWILFVILRRLSFPAPRLAALIFALHPVCVESVAWISEQKNTLSAVFYLGAALLYLRFDETRRRTFYSWAFGLFFLALLTKTVTATLPAALLVIIWWRKGSLGWRRDVQPLLPWFIVGAAAGLFTAWVEEKFIGAEGANFALTAPQRLLLAGRVIVFYLHGLAWPANLMFIYPRWSLDSGFGFGWVYLAGVLAVLAALVALARSRRGPLAGFLIFAGTLFPALGFVNVYPFLFSFVADHFQYLASIGILVPAAWGLWWLAGRLPLGDTGRVGLLLVVPVSLGLLSWKQSRTYRDSETLYRATLAKNPSAWLIHFNLAVTLGMGPGHISEAISEYEAALRLKPDHWRAHNNLASALLKLPGRSAEAIAEYQEALRYNPDYAEAQNNLGVALEDVPGRLDEAEAHLRSAIRIWPDYDSAHSNLGTLLAMDPERLGEAAGEFEAAVRIAPQMADYHYFLANALARIPGRSVEAIAEYSAALHIDPSDASTHCALGILLAREPGRLQDSVSEFRAAVRLDPNSAEAHFGLAISLAMTGAGRDESLGHLRRALDIRPDFALARKALERMEATSR